MKTIPRFRPPTSSLRQAQKPKVLIDGPHGWFVYVVPAGAPGKATAPAQSGTLLFYVSPQRLLSALTVTSTIPVEKIALVGNTGVLINFDPAGSKTVEDALLSIWRSNPGSASFIAPLTLSSQGGAQASYRVFSERLAAGGVAALVEPSALFEMADLMKGLLLATFFLTVFLFLYLIFNLKSDPLDVLRQRVKRFQIQLITELVGTPGGADWNKWRGEMEARKDEITWQIQRGIGRVSRKQKPVIDEYLSKSWAEILDLVSRRAEAPAAAVVGAIDVSRLESLIQAALKNANFILPAQKVSAARGLQVEEIRAEEVTKAPNPGREGVKAAPSGVQKAEDGRRRRRGGGRGGGGRRGPIGRRSRGGGRGGGSREAEAVEEAEAVGRPGPSKRPKQSKRRGRSRVGRKPRRSKRLRQSRRRRPRRKPSRSKKRRLSRKPRLFRRRCRSKRQLR